MSSLFVQIVRIKIKRIASFFSAAKGLFIDASFSLLLVVLLLSGVVVFDYGDRIATWLIEIVLITYISSFLIIDYSSFKELMPNRYFRKVLIMFALLLFVSPCTGRIMALLIRKNIKKSVVVLDGEFKNSKLNSLNNQFDLKLLGYIGDKIIVSSRDNEQTFILNQSAFNVVQIQSRLREDSVKNDQEVVLKPVDVDSVSSSIDTSINQ